MREPRKFRIGRWRIDFMWRWFTWWMRHYFAGERVSKPFAFGWVYCVMTDDSHRGFMLGPLRVIDVTSSRYRTEGRT